MIYVIKFFAVMLSVILADISWTYYFIKVEERKSILAAIWSSLIIVFGLFTTINYIEDKTLSIAAIIGAFIGTYLAVEFKNKNGKSN